MALEQGDTVGRVSIHPHFWNARRKTFIIRAVRPLALVQDILPSATIDADGYALIREASIMREARRVHTPGGHALVWALPRTSHWTVCALEDAGFEIRDKLYHIFGSGYPKSLNISKALNVLMHEKQRPQKNSGPVCPEYATISKASAATRKECMHMPEHPEPTKIRELSFSAIGNEEIGFSIFIEYKDAFTQIAMPLSLDRFLEAMEHVLRHLPQAQRSFVLRRLVATEKDRVEW